MLNYLSNLFNVPVWLILVVSGGALYIYLDNTLKSNKSGDKSAGFANLSDFKKLTKGHDGFQVSKNVFLNSKTCYEHILMIGPTGAGKTSSEFLPNLLQRESFCCGASSIVVTDPKGEMYEMTAHFQRSLGREVLMFAPLDPSHSVHYNPLDFCTNTSEVISLARDILISGNKAVALKTGSNGGGDTTWINMATPLFAAVLLYVWKQKYPHNTISNALDTVLESTDEELEELLAHNPDEDIRGQYRMFLQSAQSGGTVGSIRSTFASNLQTFKDPAIRRITSRSDFHFHNFRLRPSILYINYPIENSADLAPLLSVFFGQMISRCKEIEYLDTSRKTQAMPMFFLYDEFANIGQIPNFANHASTLRSYRMSLICCLQDKNQLSTVYGSNARTIFNNLKNTVIFGGLKDEDTLRNISSLCGRVEVVTESSSKNDKGGSSTSKSTREKDVLTPSEIKDISEKDILLLLKNSKPYLDSQNVFYTQNKYTKNIIKSKKELY